MSTFDGIVEEFPDIRIDYFRHHAGRAPPGACFLSHAHSDHLLGLDSLKMPFVYCSSATKRLLLKMEKYPHRINFSKGILEARKQTYKHLRLILRPLPLQTPVEIELSPKSRIRVTLFDANHCPGAVMFLIEGDGRAILYTGDLRAEPWWVNSFLRSPSMIPYICRQRRLDCLYLDTTFASHQDAYKDFPTKAEGLSELVKKVSKCPRNSVFYFRAWTLGYEDVWKVLQDILHSPVHVDRYQARLYQSIAEDGPHTEFGASLTGFQVGNREQAGCLTTESNVRVHSCEPGTSCHKALKENENTVWITPIISRMKDGTEIEEIGAGGGRADFNYAGEIDLGSVEMVEALRLLCSGLVADETAKQHLDTVLAKALTDNSHKLTLPNLNLQLGAEITIKDFISMLTDSHRDHRAPALKTNEKATIHFPYSRHSSYNELRHLISNLRPRDICPCTVDVGNWNEGVSMAALFGDLCSDNIFRHDMLVRQQVSRKGTDKGDTGDDSQRTDTQRTETASQTSHSLACRISSEFGAREEDIVVADVPQASKDTCDIRNSQHKVGPGMDKYNAIVVDIDPCDREISEPCMERPVASENTDLCSAWREANQNHDTYQASVLASKSPNNQSYDPPIHLNNSFSPTRPTHAITINSISDTDRTVNTPSPILEAMNPPSPDSPLYGQGAHLQDPSSSLITAHTQTLTRKRKHSLKTAYEAAQQCLTTGDDSAWRDLRIRCLGWMGHSAEEKEV